MHCKKNLGEVFSIEVLAAITRSFDSLQKHLWSGHQKGQSWGTPCSIQGCSQRHHQLERAQGQRAAQSPTFTAGWTVWQKLLKWGTHNSYSSVCFALFSTLHPTAVQLINLFLWFWYGWSDVHPELLWAIPLEMWAKLFVNYFHLNMPGCEETAQRNLFVWKCHNLIFSTPVKSRKTARNFCQSAEKLKLRFGVLENTAP